MAVEHFFDQSFFITELFFTVIAVIFCFLIYFKTKEIYVLTKYEGIKYFRDAFLFFGMSYVIRFLFGLVIVSTMELEVYIPRKIFVLIFILPLGYFSTIGIFYLVFSSVWKKFKSRTLMIFGHSVAVLLSVISLITRSHLILLVFQSALLILAVILSGVIRKKEKKISRMRMLYFLISVLWLINLWVIDRRKPFSVEIEIFFEVVSLAVFIAIYFKISKWVRWAAKKGKGWK